jgi:hypothetical protein
MIVGLLLVLLLITFVMGQLEENEKILMKDIKSLSFKKHSQTVGRRMPSIPQLQCAPKSACKSLSKPRIVDCINMGSDGLNIQWKCDGHFHYRSHVYFTETVVSCEGDIS